MAAIDEIVELEQGIKDVSRQITNYRIKVSKLSIELKKCEGQVIDIIVNLKVCKDLLDAMDKSDVVSLVEYIDTRNLYYKNLDLKQSLANRISNYRKEIQVIGELLPSLELHRNGLEEKHSQYGQVVNFK